ncbi:hypothetical protein KY290_017032 [Solanum tuberosum]|uniref:Integrase core domain containing protein n=1 Tax=Solanum tuberosum TaxID=4113 RepID=A0ABQ7VBR3_SOLTU|nr:hypothetical protein KY284_016099 [Solanum tuberosum]KAH0701810.1 hypothetical protein KY285_016088 [Solanum tuberosum]KAH0760959.1 hypothetical protein KY290_017032 [Solanum tuberosum]
MAKPRHKTTQLHVTPLASPEQSSSDEAHSSLGVHIARAVYHHNTTPSQSEEEEGGSESEKGSDGTSRASVDDPPTIKIEEEKRDTQEYSDTSNTDDSVVLLVREREADLVVQQQLIDIIQNTWAIRGSRKIFEKGIVSKSSVIGRRPIVPKSRVVEVDLQALPEMHTLFKKHQFEWMTKKPG